MTLHKPWTSSRQKCADSTQYTNVVTELCN